MLKRERQTLILKEINIHNKVTLSDLSTRFDVSEDTVRRDLQELADSGKIIKVRGGALSKSYHVYSYREHDIYAYAEKTVIAQKAISLLRNDMLVLISGGSTNREIARILPPDLHVTFITPSISTAAQLLEHPSSDIIFLGGTLSKEAGISIGGEVIGQLANLRADICFIGANGIDAQYGLTEDDWEIATVKRALIRSADRSVVLSISEKLGSRKKIKVDDLNNIDHLLTELPPEHPLLLPYRERIPQVG